MIIGLVGKRRVGKDCVAAYIGWRYGYTDRKFAKPLKDMLKSLFLLDDSQFEEKKELVDPRWGASPRQMMQFFGTEVLQKQIQTIMPNIGRGFAVKRLFEDISPTENITISDVRFLHEAAAIRARGGLLIRIIRSVIETNTLTDSHISEIELENIDVDTIIHNDSTIEDLYTKIDSIMAKHSS